MIKYLSLILLLVALPVLAIVTSMGGNITYDETTHYLNAPGICIAGVCKTSWPAGGSATIASSTATSASDSNNKTITAWCPSGYRATGGGGQMLAGANTDIHMENSYPTATTSGWIVSFNEGDAVAGNWQIKAYVLCIQ